MNYIQSIINRVNEYHEGIATPGGSIVRNVPGKTIIEIRSGKSFVKLEVIIGQDMF